MKEPNKYRVAVIGCRSRGASIAQAYHVHPATQVVGLCDIVEQLRQSLGDKLGVRALFGDAEQMVESTRPDIVVIATGTEFHHPLAIRMLALGVHLDIEKPISTTLAEADEMLALAKDKGVEIAVHHQNRMGPGMQAISRALQDGLAGRPRHIMASDKGYYGGLGLMNIGVHLLNYLFELGGHCRRVTAVATTGGRACEAKDVRCAPMGMGFVVGEHITATLDFGGNLTATLLLHRFATIDSFAVAIEAIGEKGRLFWGKDSRDRERNTPNKGWRLSSSYRLPPLDADTWEPLEEIVPPAFNLSLGVPVEEFCFVEEFVHALRQGRSHRCSGEEGRHALEVMMGIFESIASSRVVQLPQKERDHPLLRWRREMGLKPPVAAPRKYSDWLEAEDARLAPRC